MEELLDCFCRSGPDNLLDIFPEVGIRLGAGAGTCGVQADNNLGRECVEM